MLLYDRFMTSDGLTDTATGPVPAQDLALARGVALFRSPVPAATLTSKLAEASRIQKQWAAKHPREGGLTELFSSPGYLWLAAPSEADIAPLLEEMRAAGFFRPVQAPSPAPAPTPHPPPKTPPTPPPPPLALCATCGKRVAPGVKQCAACARRQSRGGKRPRRYGLKLLLAAAFVGLLVWWFLHLLQPPPQPVVPAPVAQLTASRKRLKSGAAVVLRWQTEGASTVTLEPGVGNVRASGSRSVRPTEDTTFQLLALGPGGRTEAEVKVEVIPSLAPVPQPENPQPLPATTQETVPETPQGTPQPATAASVPATNPVAPETVPPPAGNEEAQAGVRAALVAWASAMLSNDPRRQAAVYAPHVDRYFLQENVDNAYILEYLTKFRATNAVFRSFSFSVPAITFPSPGTAQVQFFKHFTLQLPSNEMRDVTVRTELHLAQVNGQWKITYERDHRL